MFKNIFLVIKPLKRLWDLFQRKWDAVQGFKMQLVCTQ